jgi:hypothetical protein
MSMTIGQTSATLVSAASSLGSIVQPQNSPGTGTSSASETLTVVDTSAGIPASAWDWLGLQAKLGSDTQLVATALISSMQSLILQRPDLANAQFDFQSDNGAIKVTSNTLSDSDQTWLQNLLNGNSSLVYAVQTFHTDTIASYSMAADASGTPATQAQVDAVSQEADKLGFMQLFKQMGADTTRMLDSHNTYFAPNGAKVDVSRNPASAVGLLSFMQSVQSLEDGTSNAVDNATGRVYYGTRLTVFTNYDALPSFFPMDGASLGTHVIA